MLVPLSHPVADFWIWDVTHLRNHFLLPSSALQQHPGAAQRNSEHGSAGMSEDTSRSASIPILLEIPERTKFGMLVILKETLRVFWEVKLTTHRK